MIGNRSRAQTVDETPYNIAAKEEASPRYGGALLIRYSEGAITLASLAGSDSRRSFLYKL